jgi:hypothetical protein
MANQAWTAANTVVNINTTTNAFSIILTNITVSTNSNPATGTVIHAGQQWLLQLNMRFFQPAA